jgi:hypothetical protein
MQTDHEEIPPLVLRGLQALEYASRRRDARLGRIGLFGSRPSGLTLEAGFALAARGSADQVFVFAEGHCS